MKTFVKKILEAGLVNKHTALLMEKWRQIDSGAAEIVGGKDLLKASESALVSFAEEIEDLIEKDREDDRETRLAIQVGAPFLIEWGPIIHKKHLPPPHVVVFRDEMNNFIFPPTAKAELCVREFFVEVSDGTMWTITEYVPLSVGDTMYAYQVSAEKAETW